MLDFSKKELTILLIALGRFLQEGDSKANEDIAAEICRRLEKYRANPRWPGDN